MTKHIFLPEIEITKGNFFHAYETYLNEWRNNAINMAEDGKVSASICLQATLIDLLIDGKVNHDWIGIMDEYLSDNGVPLAYSENYGKLLHKFTDQQKQSTIHSIHTKWWISCVSNISLVDHEAYAHLILTKKQSDGLIYDKDVSETTLRHRMKTELTMSGAMAVEILNCANVLEEKIALELATELVSPIKCPALGYMSMEYFRYIALLILGKINLFPVGIENHINACAEGLSFGWCDFSMKSKVDAYMGTAKRTQRDKPIHSPLIACFINSLANNQIKDINKTNPILARLNEYSCHLKKNPFDIPAFQMRDIPINFGIDKSPIELICSSFLISSCQNSSN